MFCAIYYIKCSRTAKLNLPPSPVKLPILGNLHQLGMLPHRSLRTLSEKYGPIMLLHFGTVPALIVSSADIAREVLKTQEVAFLDKPQTRAGDVLFYGCSDVAFCAYGNYWRQTRRICVLELLSQRKVQEFLYARKEEVEKMVRNLYNSCQNRVVVDVCEMFVTISNNILSRSAFGRRYEVDGDDKHLGEMWRKAMDLVGAFCFQDFLPFLGWMDVLTGLVARLRSTSDVLDDFLDRVIEQHLVSRTANDESDKDLVDILLRIQKDEILDIDLSRDNLKAILMVSL